MNQMRLCQGQKASEPYYIESIDKHIETIEEVCFYLWQYAHLLDVKKFSKEFSEWIRKSLGMEELAGQLETLRRQSAPLEERVMTVFDSIFYLDAQEREQYAEMLREFEHMTPFERRKRKADDLVRNKKYYRALQEYAKLLKEEEAKDEQVAGNLYHNMGVASCRMFFFRQGSEYFLKSFLLVPGREKIREYKTCLKLSEEPIEEDTLIAEFPGASEMDMQVYEQIEQLKEEDSASTERLAQLKQWKQSGKMSQYYKELEQMLQEWNEECRAYMREQT